MRSPTAVDPVKPTLSTRPLGQRGGQTVECGRAVGLDDLEHPVGQAGRGEQLVHAWPQAAAYSAGFHTTALPHSRAGTRYHDGTATGKLPAVMIGGHARPACGT